jgi:hypothetical protein
MLKKIIEQEYGSITVNEMHFALEGLTLEIKLKRLNQGQKTALPYVMNNITAYVDFYRRELAVIKQSNLLAQTVEETRKLSFA